MKLHLYYILFSVIFAVFIVSGWLFLFNDFPFPYDFVFWLIHGACLGANGYLSMLYNKGRSKKINAPKVTIKTNSGSA